MIALAEGMTTTDTFLAEFDRCWLVGFANLTGGHKQTLAKMGNILADSPLAPLWQAAISAIEQGVYQVEHFRVIAAARAALQGAQYDVLRQSIHTQLRRHPQAEYPDPPSTRQPAPPLMNGAAHWLMGIAIQGFTRLDANELSAFDRTLAQLQADPAMMPLAALLNGLLHELIGAVPVTFPETIPLFRWIDLWSQALFQTAYYPAPPQNQPVSATLALVGVDWQQQARFIRAVFYGILLHEQGAQWTRITFSAYKVHAIPHEEARLLLPQAQRLLRAMRDRTAFALHDMTLLASGDLLWHDDHATSGAVVDLVELAQRFLLVGAPEPLHIPALTAEKRHPIHLAEPVAFSDYRIDGDQLEADGLRLPLDMRRIHDSELNPEKLADYNHVVGLLRYDDQQWRLQPLAAVKKRLKPVFPGLDATLKLFNSPPKNHTLAILQERASRLLREK